MGGDALPAMNQLGGRCSESESDEYVHVVIHDDARIDPAANVTVVADDLEDFRPLGR
jgi:hypothetical protein